MAKAKGNSRKLVIYEDKKSRAIFLNPTEYRNRRFVMRSPVKNYGAALSGIISDADLGKAVRDALRQCT